MKLYLDYETRSDRDIKKSGAYAYVESPRFAALMCAWALGRDKVQLAIGHDEILRIPGLTDPSCEKVAHNAAFERIVTSRLIGLPTGEYLDPRPWTDTAALAAAAGRPRSLEGVAQALKLAEQKDSAGAALIRLFCVPNRKGEFNRPEDFPEEWAKFCAYCVQDVETLRAVDEQLPRFHPLEQEIFIADQLINDRGIRVDLDLARAAVESAEDARLELEHEVSVKTGIKNPSSRVQVLNWLHDAGYKVKDLRAETVADLMVRLEQKGLEDRLEYRVLECRQELALSSGAKYAAALLQSSDDGRARGGFLYHGAHTGRWTGRGLQLQNLPRPPKRFKEQHEVDGVVADLLMGNGASLESLKGTVRALFTGPLAVADYSSIEARVIAWLAGERWTLDAVREGRDIYVETANRMGGLTRPEGKVAVLALGYGGGPNSLKNMAGLTPYLQPDGKVNTGGTLRTAIREGTIGLTALLGKTPEEAEEYLTGLVRQWRAANPMVVQFWSELETAFERGGIVGRIVVEKHSDGSRHIRLPSGRHLTYHDVKRRPAKNPDGTKKTWSDGRPKTELSYVDPRRARLGTYGGRLAENVTQAVARDLLGTALVRLDQRGYRVVGHVHDEVLVDVPEDEDGQTVLDGVIINMTKLPKWAAGLPVAAEGFVAARYRKG